MTDPSADNIIVATRFSRLEGLQATPDASAAEIQYEALAALAESLDLLATALNSMNDRSTVDATRVHALQKRVRKLELLVQATSSPDDANPPPAVPGSPRPLANTLKDLCALHVAPVSTASMSQIMRHLTASNP